VLIGKFKSFEHLKNKLSKAKLVNNQPGTSMSPLKLQDAYVKAAALMTDRFLSHNPSFRLG
jgi:hypothetical protein